MSAVAAKNRCNKQQESGSIVNVSSVCGLLGAPYPAAYGAAKAAVISFTRTAALEGAEHNIRPNVVIPGVVGGGKTCELSSAANMEDFDAT